MLRTVVVYQSSSGFTKKYAEWIAEDLKAEVFKVKDCNVEKLLDANEIIFGGGLQSQQDFDGALQGEDKHEKEKDS
jgi:flavodoxin